MEANHDLKLRVLKLHNEMLDLEEQIATKREASEIKLMADIGPLQHRFDCLDEEMNRELGDFCWLVGDFDADGLPILELISDLCS